MINRQIKVVILATQIQMMKTNLLPPFFSAAQKFTANAVIKPFQKYLLAAFLMLSSVGVWGQATDLFFSEYVEGSSNNKYIEVYNGTGASVNLSDYEIRLFSNGSSSSTSTILSGTLADGATVVYKNSLATIYSGTAIVDNVITVFNGDDALGLWKISTNSYVDIFGRIGNDPGTQWTAAGGYSTLDKTLRRKSTVCGGVTANPTGTGSSAFTTLSTEWDVYTIDTITGLGAHTATCSSDTTAPTLSILSPLDDATDVSVNSNLVMTFDENVKAGTAGNIIIYNGSGTVFETIPYNDSRITYSGKTATINPTGTFANSSDYYVQIANTAIADTAGNAYAGINNTTSWNFTTVAITYTVTVTQATGGTIAPGTQSGITSGSSSNAFTATPTSCYTFASWTIDGTPNASTANPYTFTNVNANHTLTAVYNLQTNDVTASAGANGNISPNGTTAVNCGASQTYTITPNSGYAVDDVLVDGVSVGAVTSYLFTNVTSAHTIFATFKVYVGPCLSQQNFTSLPTGWLETSITYATNEANFASNTGVLTTVAVSNPESLTFDLRRSTNTVAKILYVEISTTTQAGTYTTIDTYDHSNTYSGITSINVDLSAYTSYSTVFVRFRKASSTTSPWYLKNVKVFCGTSTPTVTQPTDHFRSKQIGNWTAVSSWQSSTNGSTGWIDADLTPTSSATSIAIRNGHQVTITSGGVAMTNTTVESGGILEVTTTSSFDLSGNGSGRNIQLTIKNNGQFLVNSPSDYSSPTGNASGLIETGGKLVAGPNMGSSSTGNTGSAFNDAYLGKNNGIFYFGDAAICEWACPHTTLGSAASIDTDFFFPDNPTDMPIFRVTTSPAFEFGAPTTNNVFNSILEVISPAVFQIGKGNAAGSAGTKRFIGGIRGSGIVTQNASPTGNVFLGDGTHVPVIDGSITLNIQDNRLKLPNGANVPPGANATIKSSAINSSFDRQGGNITIDGILDITNLRITNTTTGGISVNNGGTLKTAHTGGLYGTGAAIASGTFNININSAINYNADVNQRISTGKDYYNIIFSGSGGVKSPFPVNPINIHTAGKVTITGNPTVDFISNNLASTSANTTNFDMDGGRLILGTAQLLPNMGGSYNISGGTIQFTANAFGIRTPNTYHNIEITVPANKEVSYSGGNLTLNSGGSVLVKSNATLISTSGNASLVGTAGNTLTVESGATFKTAVTSGFYGPSGLPNLSPSVRNNIFLDLQPGSNVEYARLSGAFGIPANALSGDQIITPITTGYQKLHISGDGIKTAKGDITVNEMTNVISASATFMVPAYDVITNPVYSVFHALGGINNANEMTGKLILGNDAILMQNANAFNENAVIQVRRQFNLTDDRFDYNFLSSPVYNQDMKSIYGGDASYVPFVTVLNESSNLFVNAKPADYALQARGFAVKEPILDYTGNTAIYKGKPNNGDDISIDITRFASNRGWNLIGNPYPSNLDLKTFYTENGSKMANAEFRFWDNRVNKTYKQFGGQYAGYSYALYNAAAGSNGAGNPAPGGDTGNNSGPLGSISTTNELFRYVKVGQGFMIRAKEIDVTAGVLFKNSQRVTLQPSRGFFGKEMPLDDLFRLQVISSDDLYLTQTVVYFNGGNNEFDIDDSKHPNSSASDAFYSFAGDEKVVINGRSSFVNTDVINLGLTHFSAGTYKIRAIDKVGVFENEQHIYLKDKLLNIITDISAGDYSFTNTAGQFTNRFEILYQPEIVLGADDSKVKATIQIYRDAQDFVIESSSKKITSYELYEMSGRMIINQKTNVKEIRFNAERLVDGAYVLKAELENGEQVTRKIRK